MRLHAVAASRPLTTLWTAFGVVGAVVLRSIS